jgi:hypothetical protein
VYELGKTGESWYVARLTDAALSVAIIATFHQGIDVSDACRRKSDAKKGRCEIGS